MERRSQNGIVAPSRCRVAARRYGVGPAILAIARRQHGLITRVQLLAIGMTANGIDSRVRRGSLRVIHRGVYLAGPVMPPPAQEMAAVLVCGERAYASHGSAATLCHLLPRRGDSTPVHVTLVGREVRRPGIIGHRIAAIGSDEVEDIDGVPATTPSRAILDLAATGQPADLEHLLAQAYARRLTSSDRLLRLADRYRGRPGTATLRALLDAPDAPALTRSPPERRLLALLRKARLPPSRVNARLHGWEVDFLWQGQRLVVELDALSTHTSPRDFERDRRKDADLILRGYTVIRVTRRQLEREPEAVIARIATALALGD